MQTHRRTISDQRKLVNASFPALFAMGIYALCLISLFLVEWFRGAFTPEERALVMRLPGIKSLIRRAGTTTP